MQSLNLIKPLLADEITCGHNTKSPALVYTVYSSFSLVSVQVPQADDHHQQHQQQTQSYRQALAILNYSYRSIYVLTVPIAASYAQHQPFDTYREYCLPPQTNSHPHLQHPI